MALIASRYTYDITNMPDNLIGTPRRFIPAIKRHELTQLTNTFAVSSSESACRAAYPTLTPALMLMILIYTFAFTGILYTKLFAFLAVPRGLCLSPPLHVAGQFHTYGQLITC